ncbi:MAG: transcription termination/antitermination protein NusG [Sphaerochaeta sp.]|jgi:transcriptional antiterminator NusG
MAKGWYVVNTYTGYEQKIERTINKLRENNEDFADVCTEVKVPFETVIEIKNDKEKEVKKKILPGYILVELDLPENTWMKYCGEIKRIQGVTGFLTSSSKTRPKPLNETEVKRIFQKTGEVPQDKVFKPRQSFSVGESVKIVDGPFDTFSGEIEKVNLEKGKLTVSVGIFGRSTPVEVDFDQVEKFV